MPSRNQPSWSSGLSRTCSSRRADHLLDPGSSSAACAAVALAGGRRVARRRRVAVAGRTAIATGPPRRPGAASMRAIVAGAGRRSLGCGFCHRADHYAQKSRRQVWRRCKSLLDCPMLKMTCSVCAAGRCGGWVGCRPPTRSRSSGPGPAGLSAAGRAAQLGLSHVLLEKTDHLSDTIYKYQKGKHVMATPSQLVLRSDLRFRGRQAREGARHLGPAGRRPARSTSSSTPR